LQATAFQLLDAFVGAGFNLIDTADSHSRWVPGHAGGESATIIGRWIAQRGRHDDVVIATKVGSDMGLGYKCLRRDYIMQGVEQSLRPAAASKERWRSCACARTSASSPISRSPPGSSPENIAPRRTSPKASADGAGRSI
jgi:hypothetical protein